MVWLMVEAVDNNRMVNKYLQEGTLEFAYIDSVRRLFWRLILIYVDKPFNVGRRYNSKQKNVKLLSGDFVGDFQNILVYVD